MEPSPVVSADAAASPSTPSPVVSADAEASPGTPSAETDTPDAGSPETDTPDAGSPDAGEPDAGSPDAGAPDAGEPEAESPDAGAPDAGEPEAEDGGPTTAPAEKAADVAEEGRPTRLYVVSDTEGYVGTFLSMGMVEHAVLREYPMIKFLVQTFPVAPGPLDRVWVVLFRTLDFVAFVSNSRAAAVAHQRARGAVGQTYCDDIDDVDWWNQPVNSLERGAKSRLDLLKEQNLRGLSVFASEVLDDFEAGADRVEAYRLGHGGAPPAEIAAQDTWGRLNFLDCYDEGAPLVAEALYAESAGAGAGCGAGASAGGSA